jgi:predicted helicase
MVDWPRPEIMTHIPGRNNLGLITVRQVAEKIFNHAFISDKIVESRITLSNKGIAFLFPLFIYPDNNKKDLFNHTGGNQNRLPNIVEKVFQDLQTGFMKQGKQEVAVAPEDIFYYIYAVLYSNIYREKYAEFLRIDFPRVPFTTDYNLFIEMGKLGRALADIHLMKSPELDQTFSRFEKPGSNRVEKIEYKDDCVYINKEQYFSGIQQEIWEYQVGGYQVMNKWLKDRKNQALALPEVRHYIQIARALELTIEYQAEIDRLYPTIEDTLIMEK